MAANRWVEASRCRIGTSPGHAECPAIGVDHIEELVRVLRDW
jgi:hypothetical protein